MNRAITGAGPATASDRARQLEGWHLTLLPLALLSAQVGIFVWMAPRGFDFTDESYYLLHYLHWRELTASVTFFGAYFEWPFRWLGYDVAAVRIFGMALLVGAGGFFAWRAMAFDRDRASGGPVPLPFIVGGMVASLFYYSFLTTLRVPSYNLLVLFAMLMATGLLLTLVEGRGGRARTLCLAFGYGLALAACGLGKATSAVAMVLCHAVFFAVFSRQRRWFDVSAVALCGVVFSVAVLSAMRPDWLQVLREGVALTTALDDRYTSFPFATLLDAVLRGAARLLPSLLIATMVFLFVVRRWGRVHRWTLSILVVLLVTGVMLTIQVQGYGKSWWVLLVFATALLWLAERLCREHTLPRLEALPTLGLTLLLFALPVAYSIGTNGSLPAHTQMAAAFGVVAMMLPLRRLWSLGLIHRGALAVALAALCLPTLLTQLRSLEDRSFTYRLREGILEQQVPVALGAHGDSLRVDAVTRRQIDAVVQALEAVGYLPGEPLLDVTGDGPGLVYVVGGRPLGVAWLIGGYPGSERVASMVLRTLPGETLQRAWLLSADDNPRAIRNWRALMAERIGGATHQLVSAVPYQRWDGRPMEPVTLSIWRPLAPRLKEPPPPQR